MKNNTAILVLSCDKYADIWNPFFCSSKILARLPFPHLSWNERKKFEFENVKQVFSHKKTTWSEELQIILKQIPEKNVIIILEDYFIYKKVNTEDIFKTIEVMELQNAAYLKLGAFPKKYDQLWPHKALTNTPGIGAIEKGSKYRLCLQTAIWNKEILLSLLNPSESPWQFEIEGSKRSNAIGHPFLCVLADPEKNIVHGPINYYCTALSGGKWMRGAIKLCEKENIPVDLSHRQVESVFEEMIRLLYIALPINLRNIVDYGKHKIISK